MPLAPGTRVGASEVVSLIDVDRSAALYRARDAGRGRDVALRILAEPFAIDSERLARCRGEVQRIAALNHPNIAATYGIDSHVFTGEWVEGDALSARISRGALRPQEAVPIARQIADAFAAAHVRGITHHDLTPSHVIVQPAGTIKIVGFGLSKASAPPSRSGAYLAPEQRQGDAVDRRADVWAFGVVLFEMLSGRSAFGAELKNDPQWSDLPATTPAVLRRLIHRCLEPNPRLRLRDLSEASALLNSHEATHEQELPDTTPLPWTAKSLVPWLVAGVAVGVAALWFALSASRPAPSPRRVTLKYPSNVQAPSNGADYDGIALSPDGRLVVFSGVASKTGAVGIYIRRLDTGESTLVGNTEGGRYPFWAPSSRTFAFYADGKLKRVNIDGTSPLVICDAPTGGWGGSWNRDDVIIASVRAHDSIQRVSASGTGRPVPVTRIDGTELAHNWAQFLPDGRHFLYTAWDAAITGQTRYYLASIDSTDLKLLRSDLNQIHAMWYADPGFVLFVSDRGLMAQRLDLTTLELRGDAALIAADAIGPVTSSTTGALSYAARDLSRGWNRMAVVSRDGTGERAVMASGLYADPAISPDGSRIAYAKKASSSGNYDLWIREISTGSERQLTSDPATDRAPVWSPGGDALIFTSHRSPPGLYRTRANGVGEELRLTPAESWWSSIWAYQWHPAGVVTIHGHPATSYIISSFLPKTLQRRGFARPNPVDELHAAISPDGRWLAYAARETARFEVFLTTYPPTEMKLQVTINGGAEPKWNPDGSGLFYVNATTGALMAADFASGAPPAFSARRQVHPGPLDWGLHSNHSFDINSVTGQLVLEIPTAPIEPTVVTNWIGLIRK
jgi:Tol biopolymer transport system component